MTFSRTTDLELVRQILTDPKCWRRMVNDAAPEPAALPIEARADLAYILAEEWQYPAALFLLRDCGTFAEVHFCFLPHAWGRSEAIAREFLVWVWANTDYRRLVGPVPSYNRLALKLAKQAGFEQFDVARNAVWKHGRVYDLVLTEFRQTQSCTASAPRTP